MGRKLKPEQKPGSKNKKVDQLKADQKKRMAESRQKHVSHMIEPIEPTDELHYRTRRSADMELEDVLASQGMLETPHLSLGPGNGD